MLKFTFFSQKEDIAYFPKIISKRIMQKSDMEFPIFE